MELDDKKIILDKICKKSKYEPSFLIPFLLYHHNEISMNSLVLYDGVKKKGVKFSNDDLPFSTIFSDPSFFDALCFSHNYDLWHINFTYNQESFDLVHVFNTKNSQIILEGKSKEQMIKLADIFYFLEKESYNYAK